MPSRKDVARDTAQVRAILLAAQAALFRRFVAFVLENADEIKAGTRDPYASAGVTDRLCEFRDGFLLYCALLAQVAPVPPSRACPECLERVPPLATRCRACAQPLPPLAPPAGPPPREPVRPDA